MLLLSKVVDDLVIFPGCVVRLRGHQVLVFWIFAVVLPMGPQVFHVDCLVGISWNLSVALKTLYFPQTPSA